MRAPQQTNRTSDLSREPVARPNARALRARIVESEERGAVNTERIGKPSDDAIGDCGRNPLGLARFWLSFGGTLSGPRPAPGRRLAKTVTARVRFGRVTGSGRGLLYPLSYRGAGVILAHRARTTEG